MLFKLLVRHISKEKNTVEEELPEGEDEEIEGKEEDEDDVDDTKKRTFILTKTKLRPTKQIILFKIVHNLPSKTPLAADIWACNFEVYRNHPF